MYIDYIYTSSNYSIICKPSYSSLYLCIFVNPSFCSFVTPLPAPVYVPLLLSILTLLSFSSISICILEYMSKLQLPFSPSLFLSTSMFKNSFQFPFYCFPRPYFPLYQVLLILQRSSSGSIITVTFSSVFFKPFSSGSFIFCPRSFPSLFRSYRYLPLPVS